METGKRTDKFISLFIFGGMLVTVVISLVFKWNSPDVNRTLLLLSGIGAVCGVVSTVLSAHGIIWNFVFGLVDVLIYSYGLFDNQAWSTLLLHVLYFVPMEFLGFFQWRKRLSSKTGPVKPRSLPRCKWVGVGALFAAVFALSFGVSWFISDSALDVTGAAEQISIGKISLDAMVTTANIVALVLMTFAYTEQWYLWTLVNISSVVLWSITLIHNPESYTVVFLLKYVFYLLNGLNGIRIWKRLEKTEAQG